MASRSASSPCTERQSRRGRFIHSAFTQTFSRIEDVAISPDGQLLAAAGDGGAIRLFRLPDGKPHALLTGHQHHHCDSFQSRWRLFSQHR
ncbi:MAG: hypothetical protein R3E79_46840 [Caldilineaceae bacterium]